MAGVWSGSPVHEKGFTDCNMISFSSDGFFGYISDWLYWLEFILGLDYNNTLVKDFNKGYTI